MAEIFQFSPGTDMARAGPTYLDAANMPWRPSGTDGFWMKPLASGIGGGALVLLVYSAVEP